MDSYDPHAVASEFAAAEWKKPQLCGPDGGNCVEINRSRPGLVGVRDTKLDSSPTLVFTEQEWSAFLRSERADQHDTTLAVTTRSGDGDQQVNTLE